MFEVFETNVDGENRTTEVPKTTCRSLFIGAHWCPEANITVSEHVWLRFTNRLSLFCLRKKRIGRPSALRSG